jgi:hypothetical protein
MTRGAAPSFMERIARIGTWTFLSAFTLAALAGAAPCRAQDWARKMFDHTGHDFGTVARGAKVEHRFTVQNIYLEDAHIASASASCGCTSPEVPAEVIKTWKKADIVVHVDTVNYQGQKDVTVKVKFDRPFEAEVLLSIHCYIRTDVVLDPGLVDLRASQGSPAKQRVIVRYAGRPDWKIKGVESANPSITGNVTEVSRAGGAVTYDLTINLAADAKPGYSRDELNLITNDPNPRAQRVPVPIETVVLAPVTVHPSPLIMGTAEAGKLAAPVMRPLVVRGQSPFKITSVESSDPHFQCDVPATEAAIQRLPVNFLGADAPGKVSTKLRIHTTAATAPIEADVSIDLTAPKGGIAGKSTPPGNSPEDSAVDPIFGRPESASRSVPPEGTNGDRRQ